MKRIIIAAVLAAISSAAFAGEKAPDVAACHAGDYEVIHTIQEAAMRMDFINEFHMQMISDELNAHPRAYAIAARNACNVGYSYTEEEANTTGQNLINNFRASFSTMSAESKATTLAAFTGMLMGNTLKIEGE